MHCFRHASFQNLESVTCVRKFDRLWLCSDVLFARGMVEFYLYSVLPGEWEVRFKMLCGF
jgi:hypothetical protein